MSEYWHKPFQCPFYEGNEKKGVACQVGRIKFESKVTAVGYMDNYCLVHWKDCTIAKALIDEEYRSYKEHEKKNKG